MQRHLYERSNLLGHSGFLKNASVILTDNTFLLTILDSYT